MAYHLLIWSFRACKVYFELGPNAPQVARAFLQLVLSEVQHPQGTHEDKVLGLAMVELGEELVVNDDIF